MFELSFHQITLPKASRYLLLVNTNHQTVLPLLSREEPKSVRSGPPTPSFHLFNSDRKLGKFNSRSARLPVTRS